MGKCVFRAYKDSESHDHLYFIVKHKILSGCAASQLIWIFIVRICTPKTHFLMAQLVPYYYPKYSDRQTYTNSVDPDQMPPNAASDLGLHCLHLI